jgi:hypothetical protein
VIRIWNYLIAATPDEIMALPLMEPGQHIKTLDVSEDARLFISCCVNSSQFRNVLTAWKNGQNDGLWGAKWRDKVANQVNAIKHWKVSCCDYSHVQNEKATWFIDPPYQTLAEHYKESDERAIDYRHLGDWCRSRIGQVIVCEQGGSRWLPFKPLMTKATVRHGEAREAIWLHDGDGSFPIPPRITRQTSLFSTT